MLFDVNCMRIRYTYVYGLGFQLLFTGLQAITPALQNLPDPPDENFTQEALATKRPRAENGASPRSTSAPDLSRPCCISRTLSFPGESIRQIGQDPETSSEPEDIEEECQGEPPLSRSRLFSFEISLEDVETFQWKPLSSCSKLSSLTTSSEEEEEPEEECQGEPPSRSRLFSFEISPEEEEEPEEECQSEPPRVPPISSFLSRLNEGDILCLCPNDFEYNAVIKGMLGCDSFEKLKSFCPTIVTGKRPVQTNILTPVASPSLDDETVTRPEGVVESCFDPSEEAPQQAFLSREERISKAFKNYPFHLFRHRETGKEILVTLCGQRQNEVRTFMDFILPFCNPGVRIVSCGIGGAGNKSHVGDVILPLKYVMLSNPRIGPIPDSKRQALGTDLFGWQEVRCFCLFDFEKEFFKELEDFFKNTLESRHITTPVTRGISFTSDVFINNLELREVLQSIVEEYIYRPALFCVNCEDAYIMEAVQHSHDFFPLRVVSDLCGPDPNSPTVAEGKDTACSKLSEVAPFFIAFVIKASISIPPCPTSRTSFWVDPPAI